jgi:hypothetical protein
MKNAVLLSLLTGSVLLTGLLVPWLNGSIRGPRSAQQQEAAELSRIRAGVDEIARVLARMERREPRERPAEPQPVTVLQGGAELASFRTELAGLVAALGVLRETLETSPAGVRAATPELGELSRMRPETDWLALDTVLADWEQDPEHARRSVLFLTPPEIVARFGTPTRVFSEEDGEVRWIYGDGTSAPRDFRATLTLLDGYVTGLRLARL